MPDDINEYEDYDLLRDINYQIFVSDKLKFCIQHHVKLNK